MAERKTAERRGTNGTRACGNGAPRSGERPLASPQRAGESLWNHYLGPDGSVYEIMGTLVTTA